MTEPSKPKSSPRPEWNCLPGYVAAGKLRGDPRQQFAELGLKIEPDALAEFLKDPVRAIEGIMFRRGQEAKPDDKFEPEKMRLEDGQNAQHLLDLIYRVCCVIVMAERERVVEDENPDA
jgi:hypothetical protein